MLTGKQRRHLRSLAHHLTVIVQIGKEGLTGSVIQATDEALARHELIKVKVGDGAGIDRHGRGDLASALCEATSAELAGSVGKTLILFRRNPEQARIELPKDKNAKSK